jgi:hypothetical protein
MSGAVMSEHIEIPNTKITLYGSKQEIKSAMNCFNKANIHQKLSGDEYSDRFILMNEFVPHIKCSISYSGNTVWNKAKLIRDFNKILKHGMESLSGYLYEFFHLCCGSIAHFDKNGWIATYPTLASLRNFFERNEYGQSVVAHMPSWQADAVEIAKGMIELLKAQSIKQVKCNLCSELIGDTPHDYNDHILENHSEALILKIRELFYTDCINLY